METEIATRPATRPSHNKGLEDSVIQQALAIMESRLQYRGTVLTSPQAVRDYLRLRIADLAHEVFVVLFLDAQHRLIAAEEMFRGTLSQTSVYPRGGGESRAAAQCRRRHPRPQSSVRYRRP